MIAYVIEDASAGMSVWYSAKIGRDHGGGLGWTADRDQATEFPTKIEAVDFAERRMPTLQVRVVEQQRRAV